MYSPRVPAEKKKLHQISFPSKVDLWQFYSLLFSEAHHFLPDAERHGWKKRVREHHLVCRSMVYSALSGWFTDSSVFRALKPKLIKWEQVISRWGIWPQSTIHLVVHIHIWFFFFWLEHSYHRKCWVLYTTVSGHRGLYSLVGTALLFLLFTYSKSENHQTNLCISFEF